MGTTTMAALVCLALGASALTTSRSRLPSAPSRTVSGRIGMEDFGLLKGTPFDFGKEWTKDDGSNKIDKERAGLKLFGGLLPEISFNVPGLNVDVNIKAPEVESIWEAIGFTATSNNARRVEEKMKAVAKDDNNKNGKYKDILQYWKEKYGYSKYYPGSWFYYDQLSTDPDENGRGQINTPADRKMSGFRMRKGGFYLDGTKDERK